MSTNLTFPVSSLAATASRPAAVASTSAVQEPLHARPASASFGSFLIGITSCAAIVLWFAMSVDDCRHWFVIPIFFCGVLITSDAVDWLRGRMDVFDPVGIIGLFGFHFFFLAPLLHVTWDMEWPHYIPNVPADWRPWLGGMAVLNALGLVVYRLTRNYFTGRDVFEKRRPTTRTGVIWVLDPKRASNVLAIGLVAALTLQLYTYARLGGISGYMGGFKASHGAATRADFLDNSPYVAGASVISYITGLSESFPIFAMMGFAVYFLRRRRSPSVSTVLVALLIFLALQLLFGGLRGSRSNTIFALMWATGIVHFWIRPMTRKLIFAGLGFVVLFVYVYGFYKTYGLDTLWAFRRAGSVSQFEADSGRGWQSTLLGDLARSDVQAIVLNRLQDKSWEYDLAWGRTYYAAAASVVPRFLWPDRPPPKNKEGTDLLHGKNYYETGRRTSRVFGLAGEAMMNFGPYAVPLAFLVPSFVIGRVRRAVYRWREGATIDARYLILPLFITLTMSIFMGDLGNLVYGLFKNGAFPFLIVFLSCRRRVVPNTVQLPLPAHGAAAPSAARPRLLSNGKMPRQPVS